MFSAYPWISKVLIFHTIWIPTNHLALNIKDSPNISPKKYLRVNISPRLVYKFLRYFICTYLCTGLYFQMMIHYKHSLAIYPNNSRFTRSKSFWLKLLSSQNHLHFSAPSYLSAFFWTLHSSYLHFTNLFAFSKAMRLTFMLASIRLAIFWALNLY